MKTSQASHKILGLEIIRFVASMAVLIWHYHHLFINSDKPLETIDTNQPFYNILFPFYTNGAYGVIAFWCLSGYIFFWKYGESIASNMITIKKFFILRFSRLYPLHFVTLLYLVFAQALFFSQNNTYFIYQINDVKHFILQLFMANHWGFQDGLSFNGPFWSVSVEIVVYFLFFLILRKFGNKLFLNIGIFLVSVLLFKFVYKNEILHCLIFFFLGGIIDYFQNKLKLDKRLLTIGSIVLLVVAIFTFKKVNNGDLSFIVLLPCVIYLLSQYFYVPSFLNKFVEALGNLTYGIYLLHVPIQITIMLIYGYLGKTVPVYNNLFFICFILFTLLFSRLVFLKFEMPSQNYLRRKLLPKPTAKVVPEK